MDSVRASLPATKLKLSTSEIEAEFKKWQRERFTAARIDFDTLLSENLFLEFWGRVGKSKIDVDDGRKTAGMDVAIENDDLIGEENEEETRDVREMAKVVDAGEVEHVLKVGSSSVA
jgi:hypothetical protein